MPTAPVRRGLASAAVLTASGVLLAGGAFALSELESKEHDSPAAIGKQLADSVRGQMMGPEAMARWQAANTPGLGHKMLHTLAGDYDTTMRMWMDPAAPPMESKGSSHMKVVLDGRFVHEHLKGDVMGQPFEGMGYFGFDNTLNQFNCAWVDNMNTSITFSKGSISADGKTITYVGSMNEPMTREVAKSFMIQTTFHSADHHVMEMSEILYGEKFKVMEIEYHRTGHTH